MANKSLKVSSGLDLGKNTNALLPVGAILTFPSVSALTAMNSAGYGNIWLRCDGTAYNRADYPNLWSILQNANSALHGNGTTTFTVPNLSDYFLEGADWTNGTNTTAGTSVSASFPVSNANSGNSGSLDHSHGTGGISDNHAHYAYTAANFAGPNNTAGGSWANVNAAGQGHIHSAGIGAYSGNVSHDHSHNTGGASSSYDHAHGIGHNHTMNLPVHYNLIYGIKAL